MSQPKQRLLNTNSLLSKKFENSQLQAYERYVMAQFQDPATAEQERKEAIESLIPGTLHYYHLYFLDKVKNGLQFSEEDNILWQKFDQKYGKEPQFYEIETWLNVIKPMEELKDVKKSKELIQYLLDYYVPELKQKVGAHVGLYRSEGRKPEHMRKDGHESSQSENEDMTGMSKNTETFKYDEFFQTREQILKERQKWLDENTQARENSIDNLDMFYGYENDLEWKNTRAEYAWYLVNMRCRKETLFEITNESFFAKVAEHICDLKKAFQEDKRTKDQKFKIPNQSIFRSMTIDQLDLIKSLLSKNNFDIMQDSNYVSAYFSKIFCDELSTDNQELLDNQQKLANLQKLYQYATTRKLPKSLIQNLLHEMLTLTIKLDEYNEDLFKEYLKYPLEINDSLKKEKVRERNFKSQKVYSKWRDCLQNVQSNTALRFNHSRSENDVIPKYLEHICQKKNGSLKDYEGDFEERYIKEIEKKVQVYLTDKGLIDLADDFSPDEFRRIQEQVILKFKDTNKELFKVEESVSLKLDLKNVPELVIKVFEFNTETYYKKTMQPFDTSINLHGMVPSIQKVEYFKDIPKNKIISKDFVFDELKDKVGLFIFEFLGNGQMSRAVVKKGSLSLVHRSTPAGHLAYIIDSKRNICSSDKTGVWIDKKFYKSNKDKNGSIFIPYAINTIETKVIMIHGDFAQLGNFVRKTEQYDFGATTYLNSESLLVGQEAKILINSMLTINGRRTSLNSCKNTKATLNITDFNNVETSKTFNLSLKDDEDSFITFQVTPNITALNISIMTQVQNATKNKLEDFQASDYYSVKEHSGSSEVEIELYLKKVKDNYVMYALGRNGDPQVNEEIQFRAQQASNTNAEQIMTTDKQGKIMLGDLKDVNYIQGDANNKNASESWNVYNIGYDKWTQPIEYHIIEGEAIQFPVNFKYEHELKSHQASLSMSKDGQILKNMFSRIKIIKSLCQQYSYVRLEGLEEGYYELKYNFDPANQNALIQINVHKGEYWQGNFILVKNQLFSSSSQKEVVELMNIDAKKDDQNLDITFNLKNFCDTTRVHLFATQFNSNCPLTLWDKLNDCAQDKISITSFPFAKWKNMYESNNAIGDEIKYVFDRQKRSNQMGNTLDRPSLLMKRNFVRTTESMDQVVKEGTEYLKRDMQCEMAEKAMRRGGGGGGGFGGRMMNKCRKQSRANNPFRAPGQEIYKDYQNFLSVSPLQCFNLKPDANGQVSLQVQDPQNYSQITVVACDNDSVVQRHLDMQTLLSQNDLPSIPCRDLTLNKKINPDQTVGITETREAQTLKESETVHIEDITSSQVQIVDSLDKVFKVVEQMGSLKLNFQFNNSQDAQFQPIIQSLFLDWPSLDMPQKKSLYSKHTCHEVNLYIFKRDPDFYQKVVKCLIQNKLEKTFVDWYLLAKDNQPLYLNKVLSCFDSSLLFDLNSIEICLLIDLAMTNGLIEKSKALVSLYLQSEKALEETQSYYKDGNTRIRIFDSILKMQSIDQQDFNNCESDEEEDKGLVRPEMEEDVDMGGLYGEGSDYGEDDHVSSPRRIMAFGGPPPPGAAFGAFGAAMVQNIQPMMQQTQQPLMNSLMKSSNHDIFDAYSQNFQEQKIQQMNDVGFQELEKTSEYMETHYYQKKDAGSNRDFYVANRLIQDYLLYLVEGSKGPFLSSSFIDISQRYMPFALSILDLPFESSEAYKKSKQAHKFKSDKKRGINITAGSNLILFKKEIKEGKCAIKNDIMMIHRYKLLNDHNNEDEAEDMIVNQPYKCEIIMTNISPKSKIVNLLCQIPNGSLPLMFTKQVDSNQFSLGPYTTQKKEIQFYFPNEGQFEHAPSNISEDLLVTMKSPVKVLNVIKKRVIIKVETFKDLMMTTQSDDDKKAKILELIKDREGVFFDKKFGFELEDALWLAKDDMQFYISLVKLLQEKMYLPNGSDVAIHAFWHLEKEEMNETIFQLICQQLQGYLLQKDNYLAQYILRPVDNLMLKLDSSRLFDMKFHHLEYFPMINQRVFQIGQQEGSSDDFKDILNIQFKETYSRFLHLMLHQPSLSDKHKLQFSYYLQLQDRVEEAITVFKDLNLQDSIIFDYMSAYYAFFNEEVDLAKVKQIVAKYKDYPIEHLGLPFKKIQEQIDEIENKDSKAGGIIAEQDQEVTEEQKRQAMLKNKKKTPMIHSIKIDEKGNMDVELENITSLTVKYYLIDAEILFSRSPFVKDEAKQFSFVKPFMKVEHSGSKIPMPAELSGKNVVIEVNSDDLQEFRTFYSSSLKLSINEDFGELRVYHNEKALSKVYVKVFCKTHHGQENFYRDGFTDIRGKFEYANASGKSLDNIKKFAILVTDDRYGAIIKEANLPKKK